MSDYWRARAVIDLSALRYNLMHIRNLAKNNQVFAVVKADAYGHGINNIVTAAEEYVDGFAVATIEEGIGCRKLSPLSKIIVLSELNSASQLPIFAEYSLQLVVHGHHQLQWLQDYRGAELECWVKVDSGMNRLGFSPLDAHAVIERLHAAASVAKVSLMSHFASADNPDSDQSLFQIEAFRDVLQSFESASSMGNSAALLRSLSIEFTMVRPGLLFYGVSPMTESAHKIEDLKPVMQLESRIIEVKNIKKGQFVGYGASWMAPVDMTIGIAGLGYADGYPRAASNRGYALINHCKAPIIGMVSMDMTTLDLRQCELVKPGDIVQFWGAGLSVLEVAQWSNTIPYELLCRVSARVPRVVMNH